MSKFMQSLKAEKQRRNLERQRWLNGENYLYMGDPALEWGVGGWTRGRVNLVYGPTKSGKSTLVQLAAAAEQQKSKGWVIIFDAEYAYADPEETDLDGNLTEKARAARERYKSMGFDVEKLYITQSNDIDVLFKEFAAIEKQVREGDLHVSAIIVDAWRSIKSSTAMSKIEKGEISSAGNSFGGNAKIISPLIQAIVGLCGDTGTTGFFVQHCIQNMDPYGPKWILVGGEMLKYLSQCIVFLEGVESKDSRLLEGDTISEKRGEGVAIGKKIRFKCEKSRELVEGRTGEFWINFNAAKFALPELSLFNLAVNLGIIAHPVVQELETVGPLKGKPKIDKKTGEPITKEQTAYWEFPAKSPAATKFHGQNAVIQELKNNKEFYNAVFKACMSTNKKVALAKGEEVNNDTLSK